MTIFPLGVDSGNIRLCAGGAMTDSYETKDLTIET